MLHHPTHLTANRSPAPSQGQEPQKEALEEGHHSTPRTGHPANPTLKPQRSPRIPATHPPARHTPPHQANWPAPPSKRNNISINTVHHTAKTPSPEPDTSPTDGLGTEAGIQGNLNNPERAKKPAPAPDNPQPRSLPEGPLPLNSFKYMFQVFNYFTPPICKVYHIIFL
ncbi:hypothetical protein XENOCAPTIV_008693 [Xenoophorus captivus]|uniref:Uncharacterized protein n=1 Tax=Xenoophorus captivus TaxID=1517983 RepID=A0ABV0R7Q6_9TELE